MMRWTRGQVLGRGSSATVSAATSTTTGDIFAVKSAVLSKSETLQREQKFLSVLNSPYVVTYKGYDITTEEENKIMYNLIMQYMSGGTVIDAIKVQNCDLLNEFQLSIYTRQIVQGLEYLHSNGVVHCDIKGANLLVGETGVKIADFGCAKWVSEGVAVSGTPVFMAPEVARGEEQGFAADIWAVGCVVIEMATGGLPWTNVNDDPVSVLYKIGFSGESPEIPGGFSYQAKDFISKCLVQDPKERWKATELLKHPFLQEFSYRTKEISGEDLRSPTSILDQDVWNSIEESRSVVTELIEQTFCSTYSLRQRVEQLAGNSEKVKWKWEVEGEVEEEEIDWMTIRSNESGGRWRR